MADQVASTMIGKVTDLLFGVAKKEISYMWNCTENVEKLRNEAEKLKDMRGRVQQQIDIAKTKGDDLLDGVERWVDKADAQISEAEKFLEKEAQSKKTCFNLSTLHHYGKKATNMTSPLLQQHDDGKTFETCVSVPTRAPGLLELYENKNLDDIHTQKLVLEGIIKAIQDDSVQIIGIHGLGGVGKTTLATEVATQMKNLFAHIEFITVSQTVDVEKIQEKVKEATKKIAKREKVLIILDDVWASIELSKLGIPCGTNYMNCKILITSRNRDVCVEMNAQRNIPVNPLETNEAWVIFKHVVGEGVETDVRFKQVARDIVEECGGLPLFLQVIGKALKNKSVDFWEAALHQLKNQEVGDIAPSIRKAFTSLKLSYDLLESEDAKWCFLLCNMFPEDADIPFSSLVQYGVGMGKFDTLEAASHKVRIAVDTLKSSFLLLNGKSMFTTKMHDVVRDVSFLISNEKKKEILVEAGKGLTEWQPRTDTLESYTRISLMQNKIRKLPDQELPLMQLDMLLLQGNQKLSMISDEFIRGIKNARVLDMEDNEISSLPQSLKLLTKLRMLNLGGNRSFNEISILGDLIHLEMLNLNGTGIEEIPQKIGQLVNLRRLDVKRCRRLSHIAPGVISKLKWLEELAIGYYSVQKEDYNSLVELSHLSMHTFLGLFVPDYDLIPEGVSFRTVKRFVIRIGGDENYSCFPWELPSKHHLILENPPKIPYLKQIRELIKVSSDISLENIENWNNVLPILYYSGADELESLALCSNDEASCLIDATDWDKMQNFLSSEYGEGEIRQMFFWKMKHLLLFNFTKLKDIWQCPDQYISFSNLITLEIFNCPMLVRIFSISVAQGLVNLQKLTIEYCDSLEEVVWAGGDDEETTEKVSSINVVFPFLAKIYLHNLRKLKNFCSVNCTIKYPSLLKVYVRYCDSMSRWGYGIHDTPKLKLVNGLPLNRSCSINDIQLPVKIHDSPKLKLVNGEPLSDV